ncbi:hypothetical protein [Pseudomonas sp. NPDC086278]|uniref:hypothetical protein n=1 Tax=Pseudomonas sp. NPDC086278 TaxID=3390646 RepID=UPI003D03B002
MQKLKEILIKIIEIDPSKLSNTDLLNFFISISSLAVAILSFAVAMIALVYTGYQFVLKKGTKFYGMYTTSGSVWSKQRYISEIIIENKKDKAAAINFIYLRVGSNIYLELVDYDSSPRIIAPFETIKIELREGVSGYISSIFKVDLNALLGDRKVRKALIVATPQGLSKVKNYKRFWNVYFESLQNHFIIPVRPVRKYHEGKEYSDALQFVVTDRSKEGASAAHFLYRGNTYSINSRSVKVDDFSDARELECFLIGAAESRENTLTVERVGYTYVDYDDYEQVDICHSGFFGTHVVGKAYTKIHNWTFALKEKLKTFKKK